MPAADAIPALHRLSFPGSSADGVTGVQLNPAAPTAFVHIRRDVLDAGLLVLEYWNTVLGWALVLALALLAWRCMRILKRPQLRRVPHCRRCNYDLSGAVSPPAGDERSRASADALCPECGATLLPDTIIHGRTTRRRLAPLAAAAIGFLLLFEFIPRPTFSPWPAPRLQRLADSVGLKVPPSLNTVVSDILEVDLATGTRLRTVLDGVPPMNGFCVSPSGQSIVARYGTYPLFTHYSTSTGAKLHEITFLAVPNYHANSITGFSADSSSVYLRVSAAESAPTAQIARWSLVDGSTSTALDIPLTPSSHTQRTIHAARRAFVVPAGPDLFVVAPTEIEGGLRTYASLTLHAGPDAPPVTAPIPTPIGPITDIALQRDAARLYVAGRDALAVFDTRTLGVLALVNPEPTATLFSAERQFGGGLSVDEHGRLLCVANQLGRLSVYDTAAARWLTPLEIPAPLISHDGVEFSRDGSFAAAIGWSSPGAAVPRGELLIWNIAPLRATPQTPLGH